MKSFTGLLSVVAILFFVQIHCDQAEPKFHSFFKPNQIEVIKTALPTILQRIQTHGEGQYAVVSVDPGFGNGNKNSLNVQVTAKRVSGGPNFATVDSELKCSFSLDPLSNITNEGTCRSLRQGAFNRITGKGLQEATDLLKKAFPKVLQRIEHHSNWLVSGLLNAYRLRGASDQYKIQFKVQQDPAFPAIARTFDSPEKCETQLTISKDQISVNSANCIYGIDH